MSVRWNATSTNCLHTSFKSIAPTVTKSYTSRFNRHCVLILNNIRSTALKVSAFSSSALLPETTSLLTVSGVHFRPRTIHACCAWKIAQGATFWIRPVQIVISQRCTYLQPSFVQKITACYTRSFLAHPTYAFAIPRVSSPVGRAGSNSAIDAWQIVVRLVWASFKTKNALDRVQTTSSGPQPTQQPPQSALISASAWSCL